MDYSNTQNEGIADPRPMPGFFPCSDYPQWLEAVRKAVHRYAPDVDIVFWTYNWGNREEKARLDLIRSLPAGISLEVTFEMFEKRRYPNHTMISPDYSITFAGPGAYFASEAEAAHERGLHLYSMTNTGGMTWDCGVVPYIPVPQQWFRRYEGMHEARKKWNLSGIMDSHHYGWFPSVVCECAKWSFWEPAPDMNELLRRIAVRDFGADAAEKAVAAWEKVERGDPFLYARIRRSGGPAPDRSRVSVHLSSGALSAHGAEDEFSDDSAVLRGCKMAPCVLSAGTCLRAYELRAPDSRGCQNHVLRRGCLGAGGEAHRGGACRRAGEEAARGGTSGGSRQVFLAYPADDDGNQEVVAPEQASGAGI